MNKYIKILIVLIVLPITVVITAFLAQTLSLDAQVSAQQTNLQQRVEQYKQRLQTQSSKAELDKLKLRCSVAQEKLKTLAEKASATQEKRVKTYNNINSTLDELKVVLKEKNIDITTLETQSKDLKSKTDTFALDMANYKQALEDSANSDCQTDPLAVKASLEEARNYRVKLAQEVEDIKNYVTNVITITLKQIGDELKIINLEKSTLPTSTPAPNSAQDPASNPTTPTPSTTSPGANNHPTEGATNATQ